MTDARRGEVRRSCCSELIAAHEQEKIALRLRITVLEAELERRTEALQGLLAIHEPLQTS